MFLEKLTSFLAGFRTQHPETPMNYEDIFKGAATTTPGMPGNEQKFTHQDTEAYFKDVFAGTLL